MRLDRVWVIYRADSQPAQREARQCAKELKALGSHVVTACLLYTSPSPRDFG